MYFAYSFTNNPVWSLVIMILLNYCVKYGWDTQQKNVVNSYM